jgi:serine/threonine-protein kinase
MSEAPRQGDESVQDLGDDLGDSMSSSDVSNLDSSSLDPQAPGQPRPRRRLADNTVFECQRCARLVETQEHVGRTIVPRFCPWCGRPVLSLLGRELDGYRIDEAIAAGGFGLVYLASNVAQPMMKAVVKVLRPGIGYARPEFIRVFVEEARLTEAIGQTCWNIVRVSNVREKPWPFFFMEYIRGQNLDEIIIETLPRRLPLRDSVAYLRGIARALEATHARGRVHRDLKPQNVMVIQEGDIALSEDRVKIVDFGLAMRLPGRGSRFLSGDTGALTGTPPDSPVINAGTPEYMAPEAFDGACDVRTDVYSFGVTAYEILTGERPWKDPDDGYFRGEYWRRCHREEPPVPLRDLRSEAPRWLARTVMRCLEKDPEKRIASAADLRRRLRQPRPRWVWAAAAAAVLLVAFLFRQARLGSVEKPLSGELKVYVPAAEALAGLVVPVRIDDDARDLAWTSEPPGLEFVPGAEGDLRVRFPPAGEATAFTGGPVRIEGRAGGFLRRGVHVTGELRIVVDPTAPKVGKQLRCAALRPPPGDPVPLAPGKRLRKAVKLLAEVEEEHVDVVVLKVRPREGKQDLDPVPGVAEPGGQSWSFPLVSLDPGGYTVRAAARDLAKNESEGAAVEIEIDEDLEFERLNWEALLADGRAFYRFRFAEPLKDVTVHEEGSGEEAAVELFSADGIETQLQLARFLDLGPTPLRFADLKPGKLYYLAVAAGGPKLELLVRDLAFSPPNENQPAWDLEWKALEELGSDDLGAVTIELEPVGRPQGPLPPYPASRWSDPTPISFVAAGDGAERVGVRELKVALRSERVLGASLDVEGRSLAGEVSADAVRFRGFQLSANRAAMLTLRLVDPLRRRLERTLALRPDTLDPDFQLRIAPDAVSDPPYYDLRPGAKLSLELHGASETLARVKVEIEEQVREATLPPQGFDAAGSAALSLGEFELPEGNLKLRVDAWDLAGRSAAKLLPLVINPEPPRLKCFAKTEGELLVLGEERFLVFEATDPNGIRAEQGSFAALVGAEPSQERVLKVVNSADNTTGPRTTVTFQVDLSALPDHCSGRLLPKVPDTCGRTQTQGFSFRFERRVSFEDEVSWRGVRWLLWAEQGRPFYISTTEVTNGLFRDQRFFANGAYVDPALRRKYVRPKYWAEDGSLPEYQRGGKLVPGEGFPVTGVSPDEAEEFAATVFRARLPYWEEWLSAARQDNLVGRFPWKDEEAGRAWIHCRDAGSRPAPALLGKIADRMRWRGRWYDSWRPVEADADPYPPAYKEQAKSAKLLHVLGNVAELVWRRGDAFRAASYSIAGGDFETSFADISLNREPKQYRNDRDDRVYTVGFRMVIEPDPQKADPDFLERARKKN